MTTVYHVILVRSCLFSGCLSRLYRISLYRWRFALNGVSVLHGVGGIPVRPRKGTVNYHFIWEWSRPFFCFFFFSIPFTSFALLFSLPPSRNSDPGSHSRLFSPPTHYGSCLAFFRWRCLFVGYCPVWLSSGMQENSTWITDVTMYNRQISYLSVLSSCRFLLAAYQVACFASRIYWYCVLSLRWNEGAG